ncbi:MAG: 54S ribosomal protein L17 mitochondrial [Claussenomyces sp. TS43310]|nr:MAG: 54S ribosomal protein L17 mitochondrial [Claussenomyces sp. TS43310]
MRTTEGVSHDAHVRAMPPVTSSSKGMMASAPAPYTTKSGILLSRAPLLTRALTPFEESFFFYQKRLNERLSMPFTRYFYFKKDTPADNDWKRKAKERNGAAAKELGGYQAYGKLGWNDEVLVGDKISETASMVRALVQDSVMSVTEDGSVKETDADEVVEMPLARETEADAKQDVKRLDRKLDRTLYLCVKSDKGAWQFPSGVLAGRENLHQAAERILVQSAGINMNTWIVGHVPVGHYVREPRLAADSSLEQAGEKIFFLKGRIMAGQAHLKDNAFGWHDFKWLTKQEVQEHIHPRYFRQVRNMMSDR